MPAREAGLTHNPGRPELRNRPPDTRKRERRATPVGRHAGEPARRFDPFRFHSTNHSQKGTTMRNPTKPRQQLRRMHNGSRRYNGRRYLRILIQLEG